MNRAVLGADAHLKSVDAGKLHEIGQDAEIRIGHQLPHQRGERRRRHQRQKQQDRDEIVEAGLLLQKHGDRQAEHQLHADRQHRIEQRHVHSVPEFAVAQEIDVIVEPDEALHRRQVQAKAQQRIIDRRHERDENADADEQRRQAEQIGQEIRLAPTAAGWRRLSWRVRLSCATVT